MPASWNRALHDRVTAAGWSLLLRGVGTLPWRRGQRIGASLGGLVAARRNARATRVTAANVALCFPSLPLDERDALVHASLRETGKLVYETAALWSAGARTWEAHVRAVRGIEHVDAARAAGTGVLVLAPHVGNWELLNFLLGARYRAAVMYEPPRNSYLEVRINRARAATGSEPVPTTLPGLRRVLRCLAEGGVAGLLPDQVPARESGVHVPFFGVPALTMTLPQRLLMRSRAIPVLGAAARNEDGSFDITFEPVDPAVRSEDARVAARALNQAIETLVRRDPRQYQWEYTRFKRPPVGGRSPYR